MAAMAPCPVFKCKACINSAAHACGVRARQGIVGILFEQFDCLKPDSGRPMLLFPSQSQLQAVKTRCDLVLNSSIQGPGRAQGVSMKPVLISWVAPPGGGAGAAARNSPGHPVASFTPL